MKVENIEDIYRLTPVQQEILRRELKSPGSLPVRLCGYILDGDLNVSAFERSWQWILRRHQALRVLFSWENLDEPLQVVSREVETPLERRDWGALPASEQARQLERFLAAEREAGFDPGRPPLFRIHLIRLAVKRHYFAWSYHGLLLDGRSRHIVSKDLFACYDAMCGGREFELKPAYTYKDYFSWLKRQELTDARAYWMDALRDLCAPASSSINPLPSNRRRDRKDEIELSSSACATLRSFAQRHRLSVRTIFSGMWALLLSRYIDSTEIVFGTRMSDRPSSWTGGELAVGAFSNMAPIRIEIAPGATVISWLKRLQDQYTQLSGFEHVPLANIREWSDVEPDQPLFENALVFNDYECALPLQGAGGDITVHRHQVDIENDYPTVLEVSEAGQFVLRLVHDCSIFQKESVGRTLGYLKTLIETIITGSEQRLSDLSLLTDEEQRQLLAVGDSLSSIALFRCSLSEIFEAQVDRAPEKIALVFNDEAITYRDLNERANQLAHRLRRLGVGPEVRVGVCANRSIATVVALLGIMKAGGVYTPLDPKCPQERLSYMLTDIGASVLLIEQRFIFNLPVSAASEIICLDSDREDIARESVANLNSYVTGMNLAYVIYTSGSTGRPKGVCVSHEAAATHLVHIGKAFALSADDRMLQFAALSFDVSIEQTLATLFSGATLTLRDEEGWETTDFYRQVKRYGVTVANVPPAYWTLLTQENAAVETRGLEKQLRLIIVGGDAMPISAVQRWQRSAMGESRLLNAYGPTETTITSTLFDVPPHYSEQDFVSCVLIGRPLAGRAIYITDGQGNLTPPGSRGELSIGGPLLARGYLNDPEQTAKKFAPDSYSPEPGARLYRTGDIARFQEDGQIEFLGRIDHQVKIRGFRIELAEIESALCRSSAINAAAVVAQEDAGGDKRLVAYVAARQSDRGGARIDELRDELKEILPDYMIPATFVVLDELPMTSTGKVDRRALPRVTQISSEEDHYVAPRTAIEKGIVEILAEVLGVAKVGVYDNFFQLGGHSLLATQVVSRISAAFSVEIGVSSIFEEATAEGLARKVEAAMRSGEKLKLPPLVRRPRDGQRNVRLPLSFAQQRLWFMAQLAPGNPFYNVVGAFRLRGRLRIDALERAINEIIRRHEVLGTRIEVMGGEPAQVIDEWEPRRLEVEDLTRLTREKREEEARRRAREEAETGFDLSRGPMLRARALRLDQDEHVLLFTLHHIVSDGWSLNVLRREMETLYKAYSRGEESPLPELPVQYADYALWQREWLRDEALKEQCSYWVRKLKDAPLLNLPTDCPRPERQSFKGAREPVAISQDLSESLAALSRRLDVTLYMTLLAAWQTLLMRYSGQEDIVVCSPVANRNRPEVEGLIGYFANTIALRTDLSGNPTFREALSRVREVTLDAYGHQDVPFEKLVEELQPERNLSYQPIAQVAFVLQNTPVPTLELTEFSPAPLDIDNATAKFDLTLDLSETDHCLVGSLEYSADLFEAATIRRMLTHFVNLLRSVVARPDSRLDEIEFLSEEEELILEQPIDIENMSESFSF